MLQFQNYPIYINHPGPLERADWSTDAKRLAWEITPALPLTQAARDYEYHVFQLLRLISSTRVGNLLLNLISLDASNSKRKYWIVPFYRRSDGDLCNCMAYTRPGFGSGVVVHYDPEGETAITERWFSADDVLFHEMVHAFRIGRIGFQNQKRTVMNEYTTAEEFLALHMQNVYLANRGASRFYRSVKRPESVSKGTAYAYFADDAEVLMAFRYFVEKEPLARMVATWKHPVDSFNPWRDQPTLERIYLDKVEVNIPRLPPF